MTMSILRKISVKDIDLCPLNKIEKTGCGNHIEMETDAVCLVRTRWNRSYRLRVSSGHFMGGLRTPPSLDCELREGRDCHLGFMDVSRANSTWQVASGR